MYSERMHLDHLADGSTNVPHGTIDTRVNSVSGRSKKRRTNDVSQSIAVALREQPPVAYQSRDVVEFVRDVLAEGKILDASKRRRVLAYARRLVSLFLSDTQRRELLLNAFTQRLESADIREVFGAPPYAFMPPGGTIGIDAQLLAPSRAHMGYAIDAWGGQQIPNYSQFGVAQFLDQYQREYSYTPANQLVDSIANCHTFIVRIPRSTQKTRVAKDGYGHADRSTMPPASGDVVELEASSELRQIVENTQGTSGWSLAFPHLQQNLVPLRRRVSYVKSSVTARFTFMIATADA